MKYRRIIFVLSLLLLLCRLSACQTDTVEKQVSEIRCLWPAYTFEEACDEAASIVIGTVSSVNKVYTIRLSDEPRSDGTCLERAYTELNINVEYTVKGMPRDTLVYTQPGGETQTHIYIWEGGDTLELGDRALMFLTDKDAALNVDFLRPVDSDGNIMTQYFPAGYVSAASADGGTISVDDYAALIEDYLEE